MGGLTFRGGVGPYVCGERDQNFLGCQRGRASFFSVGQRGDQNFLRVTEGGTRIFFPTWEPFMRGDQNFFVHAKGGTRKNWRLAPLPVKNDSSLIVVRFQKLKKPGYS